MAKVSRLSSFTTSYDITFLHGLLAALQKAPVATLPCTALPFRKVAVRVLDERSQRWLAAVNFLLLEAKCRDDMADEGGWKGRAGLALLSRQRVWARQVLANSEFSIATIAELPERQAAHEGSEGLSLEYAALPTSLMLGDVFAHCAVLADCPEKTVALRQLGQGLGSAIYIKDALDDLDTDKKQGRFNAITAGSDGYNTRPYAETSLRRELRRAKFGLEALGLAKDTAALSQVLDSLLVPPSSSTGPDSWARFRRRRTLAGEFGGCDCGGCDCAGCDGDCCGSCTGDCGCADACSACNCPGCDCPTCDCCQGCSHTNQSADSQIVAGAAAKPRLLCPACGDSLTERTYAGVSVDECVTCQGLWLDHEELETLSAMSTVPQRLLIIQPASPHQSRPEGTRPCPRCAKILNVIPLKGVQVDICPDCKGLFLDQGELNALLDSADKAES